MSCAGNGDVAEGAAFDELEREAEAVTGEEKDPVVGHTNALPAGSLGGRRKDVGGRNGASQWKGEESGCARAAVRVVTEDCKREGK